MTKQEFDTAVANLVSNGWHNNEFETECEERVFVAACDWMRHRFSVPVRGQHGCGIPDNEAWEGPTDRELAQFLRSINKRGGRQLLKKVAEEMIKELVPIGPTTSTRQ